MTQASWLASVNDLFSRRDQRRKPPKRRPRERVNGRELEQLEERRVMAFDFVAAYADGSESPLYVSGQATPTLSYAPQQLTLQFSPGVQIDSTTIAANISILRSGGKDDAFGVSGSKIDVPVTPGSILIEDSLTQDRVVIRFKETLPDDSYQVAIGGGLRTLPQGSTPAQSFNNGSASTFNFRLDLGAFVVSIVPQPVIRTGGVLSQARNQIDVYFNGEDRLSAATATTATMYRVFEINPTTGADVAPTAPFNPTSVTYDAATGKAVLTFAASGAGSLADNKLYRLQVGGADALLAPATAVNETAGNHSSFMGAQSLGMLSAAGASVDGDISANPNIATPSGSLEFPTQPGTLDEPGHREIPASPTADSGTHGVGRWSTGDASSIAVVQYNFQDAYGVDPFGNTLHNAITETQKQRAREVFELFSLYTGIRFEETASSGMTVVTGDVRAAQATIPPTAVGGIADGARAIMNSSIDWGTSPYGGSWFQTALHEIGHCLGLDHSYDLPSIMGKGLPGENVFPGDYDLNHLLQLYPKTGSDIDVYAFSLPSDGKLTAQTFVARPGQTATSALDSVITLYRQDPSTGERVMVARNDDYYGRDSFIGLDLAAKSPGGATYMYYVAVTSTGNTAFDPSVSDSGYGGRSDGAYKLSLDFKPVSTATTTIVDATGTQFDGDRDGQPSGACNFWFNTASTASTVFVDKATTVLTGQDGTIAKPYSSIKAALAAVNAANADTNSANDKRIVRIVGNDVNKPYLIGTKPGTSLPLDSTEGTSFVVPKGVTVMIDEGAIFKMRSSVIDVGSSSAIVNRAGASLQVLGTPAKNVIFTSYHDDSIGGNSDGVGPAAVGGQWGGIVMRDDSDFAQKNAFVNTVNQAKILYGGGNVTVDSQLSAFAPIQLERTRPTLTFNTITNSSGAAIVALPNTFEDSNGRIGPEIRGNTLLQNSINGLFVDIRTKAGNPIDKLDVPARFKSTDIVYVIQENLLINGGAGGYLNGAARQSGRLAIDPGVVVKLQGARIELERGNAQLLAEGTESKRVIFTSLGDNRYGAGGTFDTNGNQPDTYVAGDWGGIVLGAASKASIDHAYIAYGGGQTPIEGGFDKFNVIEVHQGDLRLAHSRIENNAAGTASGDRSGRGTNAAATIFVRGAQPVILSNDFRGNLGAIVSINANSLTDAERPDPGRSTGEIDRDSRYDNNFGALVRDNLIPAAGSYQGGTSAIAGMLVRGEEITVQSVWDDVDIVTVLQSEIIVQNFHTSTGIRLVSQTNASLVVKLFGANAGFTAAGYGLDIQDRIGGTVQVLGQPGYPVVLTSLTDDSVGAGLDPLGRLAKDTNLDSLAATPTTPSAGQWRSLKFLPLSNDRNVAILQEQENPSTAGIDANSSVDSAESLGVLAPNYATGANTPESAQEKSGNEGQRLGFQVHGSIAADTATDVDVYAFTGYAGSEAWIDIDKTSPSLDAMVELLDAAGNVLARSMDSVLEGGVQSDADAGVVDPFDPQAYAFQLTRPAVIAGSLSGTVTATFNGNVVTQRYRFDADGNVTFADARAADNEPNRALAGTVDVDAGLITFLFSLAPDVPPTFTADYTYQTAAAFSAATLGIAQPLAKDAVKGGDYWTVNPKDPGMRVILPAAPGQPAGAATQYYIRVRSQPRYDAVGENGAPATTQAAYETALQADPTQAPNGATSGRYTLQVRLSQRDEVPGSTVSFADIRYATTGIDVQGLPHNSPLTGENGENATDANNTFNAAQYVGNLLQTDRNTISIAGTIAGATDVDWYTFALNYEEIQSIGGVNGGGKTWATLFDLDYGDGFRGDLSLAVFDSTGKLIFVGRDSNVASDQPGAGQGSDFDDLSRGSSGALDPFIGSVMMPAGTPTGSAGLESGAAAVPVDPTKQLRYYVAVSSNESLPTALDATFKSTATNSLVRLEPVNSVRRVVEDHIGFTGYTTNGGLNVAPTGTGLIDTRTATSLDTNVRAFTLADVTLFASDNNYIYTYDAKTGLRETTLNSGSPYGVPSNGFKVGDLDMRPDGRLYAYGWNNNDNGNAGRVVELDSGTGGTVSSSNDGIANKATTGPTNIQTNSTEVQAVAFRRTGTGDYNDLWLVIKDEDAGGSKLYKAADGGTAAAGGHNATASQSFNDTNGLGYRGHIGLAGSPINVTGIQFSQDAGGTMYGVTDDGMLVSIAPGGKPGSDTGGNTVAPATLICDYSTELTAVGATGFVGMTAAPQNLYDGLFRGQFFALTNNGRLVLLNPNGPISAKTATAALTNASTSVTGLSSVTGNLANLNGMVIFGAGIQPNTTATVTAADVAAGTMTLSLPATATNGAASLTGVKPAVTRNGATTNASTTVTIGNASLAVGMVVIGNGIPAGTVITALNPIAGTIALSQAATATAAATSLRFLAAATMPSQIAVEQNGVLTKAATTVTTDPTGLAVDMEVVGDGIPSGTTIVAVDAVNRQITLSNAATSGGTVFLKFLDNHATRQGTVAGGALRVVNLAPGMIVDDLRLGMLVFGNGVAANTTVTAIDRTNRTVTVSTNLTAGTVDLAFVNASSLGYVSEWAQNNNASPVLAANMTGLAFSPLDINLWHVTQNRGTSAAADAGHGINAAPDNSRTPGNAQSNAQIDANAAGAAQTRSISQDVGGASMWFGLEQYTTDPNGQRKYWVYSNSGNDNGQFGVEMGGTYNWQEELTANPSIRNNYNLPGGAYGSTITNAFSLAGYVKTDSPTLYFNYFLDAQQASGSVNVNNMRDSARVFVSNDNGLTWTLLATNNTVKSSIDTANEELPTFVSASARMSTNTNQDVQQLYDVAGWRQARIDLANYAGQSNLRLRFDFSTAGEFDATQTDVFGDKVNDINGPAGTTGNFSGDSASTQRGQNNAHEGFYFDDIIVAPAERGEMVTGAVAGQTSFYSVGTAGPSPSIPAQNLQGPYELSIRRGTQYGGILDAIKPDIAVVPFLSNTDMSTAKGFIGDDNPIRQQGQFLIQNNIITNSKTYGISIDAAARDTNTNAPNQGVVQSLPVLSANRLVPGAVVANNVISTSGTGGILFSGDPNTGNVPLAARPFGRLVNNTIYGGATQAGIGINVTENAAPTLLNNLFVNVATGVAVDATSTGTTVVATSAYFNVRTAVTGATESQQVTLTANPFVNAAAGNFYLLSGSLAIDSAINALADRVDMIAVTSPLGIPESPIIVPDRDLYGQLRVDDPDQASLPGLGSNTYKDRGAIDRVDFTKPVVTLLSPLDGSVSVPVDKDPAPDAVRLERSDAQGVTRFVLQLNDTGVGIDKSTVSKAAFSMTLDGVPLVEGTDYIFSYFENNNTVVFKAPANYSPGTYVVTATARPSDAVLSGMLTDLANNPILPNKDDGGTTFSIVLADVPGAPSGLVGTPGDTVVQLAWTAANGTAISDYAVEYSSDNGTNWNTFVDGDGTGTTALVTGLTNNVPYLFRVTAVNAVGGGIPAVTPLAVTPVFYGPTAVVGVPSSGYVDLTWTAPTNSNTPISDYLVQYSSDGGANWTTFPDDTSTNTGATVTGLTDGTAYIFRVAAVNDGGQSDWSAASDEVTPRASATAPTNVQADAGDRQVTLSWATPGYDGGTDITGYRVQYTTDGNTVTLNIGVVNTYAVTGLTNGVPYVLRVAAVTGYGVGIYSADTDPITPVAVAAAPTGLVVTPADKKVDLSWTAPSDTGGLPITDYVVQYKTAASATWLTLSHVPTTSTSATITGLTNSTPYVFRVAAVNDVGPGAFTAASSPVAPVPLAAAPTSLTGRAGNGSVSLAWRAPVAVAGVRITDYQIQYSTDNGLSWTVFTDAVSTATSATVTGLANGVAHLFRVAAVSSTGVVGNWSASVKATPFSPTTVPTTPSGVVGIGGSSKVVLNWTAPAVNAGGPVVDYIIQYRLSTSSVWVTVADGVSTATTATITRLSTGRDYVFRVAAKNLAGVGAYAQSAPIRA